MNLESSQGLVRVAVLLQGAPVVECFECDDYVPLSYVHWFSELSSRGRVLALLPHCKTCLADRELKQRIQELREELQRDQAMLARRQARQ